MLCGVTEIDVDDWQSSTKYDGGYSAESDQVKWFWAEVRRMTSEDRGKLLHFCTGSARAPATGFANLMGYTTASSSASPFSAPPSRWSSRPWRPRASTC